MTDLVQRVRRGNRSAFDDLYERHVGHVFALCLRLSADEQLAEELTQDVFVRVWERIDSFEGRSRFSTWLHRLTVNCVLDEFRRQGREGERSAGLENTDLPPVLERGSESRIELERALTELPDRARTALVLYAVEGHPYREVADLMGVALGTVKAHIHRARSQLLEELER